ncbi:hypothetical protein LCGC14_0380390 [marine sediment metagenome]|uniref:Uncharacterized protein n=1 Tax=marine sediment metagenome TaxID=412755 RepID=A0A0F9WB89_9ZZZZ
MNDELLEKILSLIKKNPKWGDQRIANQLKISRTTVWRVRSRGKSKALLDPNLLSDEELELYNEYRQKKKLEKEGKVKKFILRVWPLKRSLADGNLDSFGDSTMLESQQHHNNFLDNYKPQYNVQAVDVKVEDKKILNAPTPFTAREDRKGRPIFPKFFINPLQALDYIVLQDIYMHTICGSVIDVLTSFTMGRGIRPILKLNKEDAVEIKKVDLPIPKTPPTETIQKDDSQTKPPESKGPESKEGVIQEKPGQRDETKQEAIVRVLDENKELLDPIIAIDESFSDPEGSNPMLDEDFNSKIEAMVRNHWIYGRCMMTYEYFTDNVFEFENTKYPNIPNVLKVMHPRDMGFVQIEQSTLQLRGIQLMFATAMIESPDMLYLEHSANSAIYNGKFYGYSKMQRMIGHGRSLRKLIDRDFPNVSTIGYAGFSVIAFKGDEKGMGSQEEEDQNTAFVNSLTIGSPNAVTLKDPEHDMKVHDVNTDAKIKEMIEMAHYHAEASAKSAEVPTTLVSKEKDPNRDTLLGILRLFMENVIKRHRIKIGKQIAQQWYMKNFRIIYGKKPEVLKQFHIEAEFDDFKLESWADLVASVKELMTIKPLKADAIGELLGLQNFENMIDPEGSPMDNEMTIDGGDGSKTTLTQTKTKMRKQPQPNQ